MPEAVSAYWHEAGNFSALAAQCRHHVGAQLCRPINAGRDPDDVAPALAGSEGAWAVLNDWSQFAGCLGDVATAYAAAQSAYRALGIVGEVERAVIARHCADACIAAGRLPDAVDWPRSAWRHATAAIRRTQSIGTAEIMDAFRPHSGVGCRGRPADG